MVMRIKRTIDIAMNNYSEILGSCVFTYEGRVAYATENMQIAQDVSAILMSWQRREQSFTVGGMAFLSALTTENGFVGINPEGALCFICGTGKGVWFVSSFTRMDTDKSGILRECVQAAKNIESSVSAMGFS
ncbi:MAG: hypothetical protein KAU89_05755 [Candidatus Thorarchaeota archaeon]|nr:hypothetical protein [Candidatus Thorarchaeota archaeon]